MAHLSPNVYLYATVTHLRTSATLSLSLRLFLLMALFSLLVAAFLFVLVLRSRSQKRKPLPPGPPADPLIGHLRSIPSHDQGRVFYSWAKLYGQPLLYYLSFLNPYHWIGDVMHSRLPGKSIVVLDSAQAAIDLLDKAGSNFSCRPKFSLYELWVLSYALWFHDPHYCCRIGWVSSLILLPYGPQFARHHKIFQQCVGRQELRACSLSRYPIS